MKRLVLAVGLCSAMLATAVFVFMPKGFAKGLFPRAAPEKENVLEALLDLPAPPPPNPLETSRTRDEIFYDPKNPPPDNAPIEDLIDYWSHLRENYRGILYYVPKPSARVVERLLTEGGPSAVPDVLDMLPDDRRTGDIVKQIYDDPSTSKELKNRLKYWLTLNSSYFADETQRSASLLKDVDRYVSAPHQNALLALTRHDWDRARPIVDRLYSDSSQPVSRALATWALYRHAMEAGDPSDTERYRGELMRMVENRSLPDGVRDMANDAIVRETDFPGRDEWCWSLFEDETLVNMPYFTGLTTLIMYAPPDKYVSKMAEFLKSTNKTVRMAAARNLTTALEREKSPEVVRALLPWIGDPNWIDRSPDDSNRISLVTSLQSMKMPESVPPLIAALDEKATRQVEDYGELSNSNTAVYSGRVTNAMRAAANAMANAASTVNANANRVKLKEESYYPLREYAVRALGFQADPRAAPALKSLLNSDIPSYQRIELVSAILACSGFSVSEQVDALEKFARAASEFASVDVTTANNSNSKSYYTRYNVGASRMAAPEDALDLLGQLVGGSREPSDDLVGATVARIEKLEPKDPVTAQLLKGIVTNWKGLAVSALLLSDLKAGKTGSASIVRLLIERRSIREKLGTDVDDASKGTPIAAGIGACLLNDPNMYTAALANKSTETRTAVLACARLIRAELPLAKVAEDLKSTDPLLKTAAELYLESEDSTEARSIVYSQHPGEAKILGATAYFPGRKESPSAFADITSLFATVTNDQPWAQYMYCAANFNDLEKTEERLQKEVKDNAELIGVYAYQDNFVRIYKDKAVFSWDDDPSRYHERILPAEDFDRLKTYLAVNRVSELKPFLACPSGCGPARELLMLGKNGGSRIFVRSERTPRFFAGLERLLSDFRAEPSAIKYALSKDVPGLELLFASDQFDAETVWKQGSDLRIVVGNKEVREKVDEEIRAMEEQEAEDDASEGEPAPDGADREQPPDFLSPTERLRIQRQYEGFEWRRVENGRLGEATSQPEGDEYIPRRDGFNVQPNDENWKARTAAVEIRADVTGLYKVVGGKVTKLKDGDYSNPVVTPNGRWVIVDKSSEDQGPALVRYNLVTNREFPVLYEGDESFAPRCFIPGTGKILLIAGYYGEGYVEPDEGDGNEGSAQRQQFYILDPETGLVLPARGEMRPLSAQTFRPLQPSGKPNEFWAALPSRARGNTVIGLFDSRLLRFKSVLQLPKINFGSMDMWVDEAENKAYFVYSGHLLRVPLKTTQSK